MREYTILCLDYVVIHANQDHHYQSDPASSTKQCRHPVLTMRPKLTLRMPWHLMDSEGILSIDDEWTYIPSDHFLTFKELNCKKCDRSDAWLVEIICPKKPANGSDGWWALTMVMAWVMITISTIVIFIKHTYCTLDNILMFRSICDRILIFDTMDFRKIDSCNTCVKYFHHHIVSF